MTRRGSFGRTKPQRAKVARWLEDFVAATPGLTTPRGERWFTTKHGPMTMRACEDFLHCRFEGDLKAPRQLPIGANPLNGKWNHHWLGEPIGPWCEHVEKTVLAIILPPDDATRAAMDADYRHWEAHHQEWAQQIAMRDHP